VRLALVDRVLATRVAFGLGMPVPDELVDPAAFSPGADGVPAPALPSKDDRGTDTDTRADRVPEGADASGGLESSPALSMNTDQTFPIDGRVVHILANDGCDVAGIRTVQQTL